MNYSSLYTSGYGRPPLLLQGSQHFGGLFGGKPEKSQEERMDELRKQHGKQKRDVPVQGTKDEPSPTTSSSRGTNKQPEQPTLFNQPLSMPLNNKQKSQLEEYNRLVREADQTRNQGKANELLGRAKQIANKLAGSAGVESPINGVRGGVDGFVANPNYVFDPVQSLLSFVSTNSGEENRNVLADPGWNVDKLKNATGRQVDEYLKDKAYTDRQIEGGDTHTGSEKFAQALERVNEFEKKHKNKRRF